MATRKRRKALKQFLFTAILSTLSLGACRAQDPPMRVADLNYIAGNVSIQPAGADEWSPAGVNRPLTTGDYLWSDAESRAELHWNNAVLRLGGQTSAGFLNLDDRMVQLRFAQGELLLRVWRMGEDDSLEVDTPSAAITILREGEYRFNADADSAMVWVTVRHGEAEVTGGGQAFTLRAGDSAQLSGTDQLAYDVQGAPEPDWLEGWAADRDAREARGQSARYLPPDVIGYQDLDDHGVWQETPGYGAVWYPAVNAGWAPYHYGHWAWIEPWGWTWVDDSPWGFATCHYGRWAYFGGGWGWIPGPVAMAGGGPPLMRPVYAPALVAFIGGGGWGASLSFGGPAVGWVSLGPGEVYAPAYQVSRNYFRTVNVSNTTVVNNVNITNVYNNVYVNRTVNQVTVNQRYANMTAPRAVTAMPRGAFAAGRPVTQAGITVPRNQTGQLRPTNMAVAPPVAPVRQSLAPVGPGRPVARPPMRAVNMPVVAKAPPPAPPLSFAVKQPVLQRNAGRPLDVQGLRQAVPPSAVTAPARVTMAPPARQAAPPVRTYTPATPAYRPPSAQPPQPQSYPRPAETYPRPPQPQPSYPRPAEAYPRPAQPPPPPRRQPEQRPKPQPKKPEKEEKPK